MESSKKTQCTAPTSDTGLTDQEEKDLLAKGEDDDDFLDDGERTDLLESGDMEDDGATRWSEVRGKNDDASSAGKSGIIKKRKFSSSPP